MIIQVVFGLPVEGPFDYLLNPEEVNVSLNALDLSGRRVDVPFGRTRRTGFIIGVKKHSAVKGLKTVVALLDNAPLLDADDLKFSKEFAQYYGCSWGEAIEAMLPKGLRGRKPTQLDLTEGLRDSPQKGTVPFRFSLCQDVGMRAHTKSLRSKIRETLDTGKSVIILVPGKSRINPIEKFIKENFSYPIAVWGKNISAKKETEQWLAVREGKIPIVVGTRSAVFAPCPRLGLLVVYDEDNTAYKQEQSPFYHARDTALMRAKEKGARVLFISSAPSAELWHQITKTQCPVESLPEEKLAPLQFVDLANYKPGRRAILSFPLQNQITETLARAGKVLLFLNRRGFSAQTRCQQCGHTLRCERCNVNLTYLYARKKMICRLCHTAVDVPKVCPQCRGGYLTNVGTGIEKVESELARMFPQATLGRCDRDTREFSLKNDIVIATQAVLTRLESFPVALIGVLDIDGEFNRGDFRAGQRVFSLLVRLRQAAGEKVLVQTYQKNNYSLKAAAALDFKRFYRQELKLRRELGFPPYQHLLAIGVRGIKENVVFEHTARLYDKLLEAQIAKVDWLEPQPDVQPKVRDKYRFTIMAKTKTVSVVLRKVKKVIKGVRPARGVIVTLNVDP